MNLNHLAERSLADSRRWFPELHDSDEHAATHFTLGLIGETGEVANLVKKVHRGDMSWFEARQALGHEIADVIIYALDLAAVLGIDMSVAFDEKRAICEARWGHRAGDG